MEFYGGHGEAPALGEPSRVMRVRSNSGSGEAPTYCVYMVATGRQLARRPVLVVMSRVMLQRHDDGLLGAVQCTLTQGNVYRIFATTCVWIFRFHINARSRLEDLCDYVAARKAFSPTVVVWSYYRPYGVALWRRVVWLVPMSQSA